MKENTKDLLYSLAKLGKESVILLFRITELALVVCGFVILIKSLFK